MRCAVNGASPDQPLVNHAAKVSVEPRLTHAAKATEIYRKTGNLRAIQLLLGHTKVDRTIRYLCVELEDALSIDESIDI